MKRRPRMIAAWDVALCLLIVFIGNITRIPPQVKTYGQYAVVATWPAGKNDVDLYVRDSLYKIAYFANTQIDQMQLEHDDLGTGTGTGYAHGVNEERTVLRGTSVGQYVVNAHFYHKWGSGSAPIPVTVTLWDLRGQDKILKRTVVYVQHTGDERTAFRFYVNAAGSVTGYDKTYTSLVQRTTQLR